METTPTEMRVRLVTSGVRQTDVAAKLGMDETLLSRILNGRRRMPEGFPERFERAVEAVAVEQAKRLLEVATGKAA